MTITNLQVTNFRNLFSLNIELHNNCNLFYGKNGSGKTSILEAIYYLGFGRSFRTHLLKRLVNDKTDKFSLFCKIKNDSFIIPLGIERSFLNADVNQIKISGEKVRSTSELVKILPLQLLNQTVFRFFEFGPKVRRQFVDWGLFHVEPTFFSLWKKVERILEQRNAALRSESKIANIKLWDKEFVQAATELDIMRKQYITELIPLAKKIINEFLGEQFADISIEYYSGWDVNYCLSSILDEVIWRDKQFGYTSQGPQRADLLLKINNTPAQDILSRGQQKLVLYALTLAQGQLMQQKIGRNCLYLIDDLTAELDEYKQRLFINLLMQINAQIFITALNDEGLRELFSATEYKMFHVEHGAVE